MSEVTTLPVERQTMMDITPQDLAEAKELATLMSESDLVPKDYHKRPHNILVAMMMGSEVGLRPMQALQNIAVINGRPSVWGDAALAIVRAHPRFEWIKEEMTGEGGDRTAVCTVKRRGEESIVRRFSVSDAINANLWDNEKKPIWRQYPERMLAMRARGFAIRDAFPDALRGMYLAEEAQDIPEKEVAGQHTFASDAPKSADDKLKDALRGTESAADPSPQQDAADTESGEDVPDMAASEDPDSVSFYHGLVEQMAGASNMQTVRLVMKQASESNDLTQEQRSYLADMANQKREELK